MKGKQVIGGQSAHGLPYSRAYRAGDLVFLSGQVALDETGQVVKGGIERQTRQVLRTIEAVLADAGCSLADVIKTTVWLEDVGDFGAFNKVYAEFFPAEAPARSTVRADLMVDAKVEIEVIAYKPQ